MSSMAVLAVLVFFVSAVLVFAHKTVREGRPQSERVMRQGASALLGAFFMEFGLWLIGPLTRLLVRLRVHPDVLSWVSLVLQFLAAPALAAGYFVPGGLLLTVGAFCDALDGGVARARGMASDAGEVLDAMVDRWAELAIFFAFAWYYRADDVGLFLSLAACAGALMVSYTRAKAEALGVEVPGGPMQRHERAVYLCVSALLSPMLERWVIPSSYNPPRHHLVLAALALIAAAAHFTAVRRVIAMRAALRKRGR